MHDKSEGLSTDSDKVELEYEIVLSDSELQKLQDFLGSIKDLRARQRTEQVYIDRLLQIKVCIRNYQGLVESGEEVHLTLDDLIDGAFEGISESSIKGIKRLASLVLEDSSSARGV